MSTYKELLDISYSTLQKRNKSLQDFARSNILVSQSKDYYRGVGDSLQVIFTMLQTQFYIEANAILGDKSSFSEVQHAEHNAKVFLLYSSIIERLDSLACQNNILELEYFGELDENSYVN